MYNLEQQNNKILVDEASFGCYVLKENRFIFANAKLAEIFGYTREEIMNIVPKDLFHPDDKHIVEKNMQKRVEKEVDAIEYTVRGIKKDDSEIFTRISGFTSESTGKTLLYGTVFDNTEQYKSEIKAKFLANILETSTNYLIVHDFEGNVEYVNKTVYRDFALNDKEVKSKKLSELCSILSKKLAQPQYWGLLETGESVVYESFLELPNDNSVHVEVHARVVLFGNKQVIVNSIRNISRLKKAEEELLNSNMKLEKKVEERTLELKKMNNKLHMEIEEHKKAEEVIIRQSNEIMELSTPVVRIWEGVVAVPLIGTLDSQRAEIFAENLLEKIIETNSKIALIDITGVPAIDTKTAQYIIDTISAVRLIGSNAILTGIRPSIAQTLVHLGIELSDIVTKSTIADGLKKAFEMLNLEITNINK